ncbi:MAG TPA: hypothetical protein VMD59_14515, partial [Acidimicrobiales bacterium]|nr:hypothetical protein [Acidimicrobiales bacterium]
MRTRHRVLAAAGGLALTLGVIAGGAASSGASAHGAQTGGTITFAEQPGFPPNYIFPLYDGANSGN